VSNALDSPDKCAQATKRARFDTVTNPRTIYVTADEARIFEHLEVLGYRGLSEWHFIDNITANTRIFSDQNANDLHPSRMRERLRKRGELIIGLISLDRAKIGRFRYGRAAGRRDHRRQTHR